jgi:ribosomal protein S18 acetylase RimI-like enzyme
MPVSVEVAEEATPALVDAFVRLLPQLSTSAPALTKEDVEELLSAAGTTVFVARDGDDIVGSLTLVVYRVPTGLKACIEDVVVDEAARGKGVGEALTRRALDMAAEVGVTDVDLTSRPSREAANRLYQRLGFERRQTNVYRYTF